MRGVFFSLMLFCLLASGCASRGLSGSYFGDVPRDVPAFIAADAVDYLATIYPPGRTTLRIAAAKKADNSFAAAMENGLRQAGFSVLAADAPPAKDCITIAYTLDILEDVPKEGAASYLQLRLSDGSEGGKAVSRAYAVSGQPEAGRSSTPLGKQATLPEKAKATVQTFSNALTD